MSKPPPPWTAPAHLTGLPYTDKRKRTGTDMRGTLAECLERWIALPHHHQINCSLAVEGTGEPWEPERMAAFIRRHGPPPALAARAQASAEWLMAAIEEKRSERDFEPQHFSDAAGIVRGYGR